MRWFLEFVTIAACGVVVVHAGRTRGRWGLAFLAVWFAAGLLRETWVVVKAALYSFSGLELYLGPTPVLAAVIWGFSAYAAMVFAEEVTGERLAPWGERRGVPSLRWTVNVALFMMALACFYEPILAQRGMAKWQDVGAQVLGTPAIALVGYPTMTLAVLVAWALTVGSGDGPSPRRWLVLGLTLPGIAWGHAAGLTALKAAWGW